MDEKPAIRRSIYAVWRWPKWALASTAILAILSSYAIAYFILVKPTYGSVFDPVTSERILTRIANYPYSNCLPLEWKRLVFLALEPAHCVDRWIRPAYWEVPGIGGFGESIEFESPARTGE